MKSSTHHGSKNHSYEIAKRYVLVVEDNSFSLNWVTTQLSQLKYEAVIAENGKEAVSKFFQYMKDG